MTEERAAIKPRDAQKANRKGERIARWGDGEEEREEESLLQSRKRDMWKRVN